MCRQVPAEVPFRGSGIFTRLFFPVIPGTPGFPPLPQRELVKYLNNDSHHHCNRKRAVLSGAELRLALLTTMTNSNADLSLSDIYPDKHEALRSAGQLSKDQKMRTLSAVLEKMNYVPV